MITEAVLVTFQINVVYRVLLTVLWGITVVGFWGLALSLHTYWSGLFGLRTEISVRTPQIVCTTVAP
jgi:hypothetical protein